jgi:hypothetical protein
VPGITRGVELKAEELKTVTDAFADGSGMFTDCRREDQGVEAADRGDECSDGLLREITQPRNRSTAAGSGRGRWP